MPSAPRTNRTLSEMVPERCLTLALAGTKAFELEVQPDIPRGKFLDGSAPRSNGFLIPSERRRDQRLRKKVPATILQAMRPSLAVDYTAHVADGQRSLLQ